MSHDNFTTLLVALINAIPWAVGLWLAHKRRLEKKARERINHSRRHHESPAKTEGQNRVDKHGENRAGNGSGRTAGHGDS